MKTNSSAHPWLIQDETLCEFFNAMVSSIRLLRLKKLPSTFTRLCQNISSLTDRRFTIHHLAQLKFIVPEAITVKKIRVQDEETHCMKEELLIALEAEAGYTNLIETFQSRIADYLTNHPEDDDDIPEGELPQLFYKAREDPKPSMTSISVPVSHISPSFKRRFSARDLSGLVPELSPLKPSSCFPETPVKEANSTEANNGASGISGTPAKFVSTPSRLMVATPALCPPKRSLSSLDHDDNNDLPNKSARLSLKFDKNGDDFEDQSSQFVDGEANFQKSSASSDILGLLPEDLVHSLIEKERKILEEQDPAISQARRRQHLMAGVPKLFDMIHLLFQSINRCIMTKEELIHKIVAGHLDVVDRREVDEQLKLLLELAPEYISEKPCLSGDILLRINKLSCPELVRAKLLQAK